LIKVGRGHASLPSAYPSSVNNKPRVLFRAKGALSNSKGAIVMEGGQYRAPKRTFRETRTE
jgi:hypothetical protein